MLDLIYFSQIWFECSLCYTQHFLREYHFKCENIECDGWCNAPFTIRFFLQILFFFSDTGKFTQTQRNCKKSVGTHFHTLPHKCRIHFTSDGSKWLIHLNQKCIFDGWHWASGEIGTDYGEIVLFNCRFAAVAALTRAKMSKIRFYHHFRLKIISANVADHVEVVYLCICVATDRFK